jgi:hypothetical protein
MAKKGKKDKEVEGKSKDKKPKDKSKDKKSKGKKSKDKKSKDKKSKKGKERPLGSSRVSLAITEANEASDLESAEHGELLDSDRQLGRRLLDSALRLSLEKDDELARVARLVAGGAVDSLVAARHKVRSMLERVRDHVPADALVGAPADIAGPTLELVRYLEPGSPRFRMCEAMLIRACHVDTVDSVHPAFPRIIAELSDDEAMLLEVLDNHNGFVRRFFRYYRWTQPDAGEISCYDYEIWALQHPWRLTGYLRHLGHLGLLKTSEPFHDSRVGRMQISYDETSLTAFGRELCAACVAPLRLRAVAHSDVADVQESASLSQAPESTVPSPAPAS